MNSYSETAIFPAWTIALFYRARMIVEQLSDCDSYGPLRCHEVARIVAAELEGFSPKDTVIEVWDGHYAYVEHSWILLKKLEENGSCSTWILDPYAVGRLPQVQLVNTGPIHVHLYRWADASRDDIREDVIQFERARLRARESLYGDIGRVL